MTVAKAVDLLVGKDFTVDVIPIQGVQVETRVGMLNHGDLKYFLDNPRVYSIVREEGKNPNQEDIQVRLQEMEHVKALVQDIKKHEGLIDPLVVKSDSLEVVEGNSRLAAYRLLAQKSPKWALVKVRLLPVGIDDKLVASLLGQWHLRGKKEWPPYEQAGYLYRRHTDQNISLGSLATEAGISAKRVEGVIDAFRLMVEQKDTKRERWSYYDEFVKSRKIAKACEKQVGLKERVLSMVKHGDFERAQDFRDMLPVICDGPAKNLAKFAAGKLDFTDAFELAQDAGGDNVPFQKMRRFRQWLASQDSQDAIAASDGAVRDRIVFEAKQLLKLLGPIVKKGES
jgi:ParB-like nuclease domain